jgi:uncharacterized membrane protein YhaH (DUF805 family)
VAALLFAALGMSVGATSATQSHGGPAGLAMGGISIVLYLAIVVFAVVFGKRRLNDLNRSGWFLLLLLVPLVNVVLLVYLVFFKGTEGVNDYGPAPAPNNLSVTVLGLLLPVVVVLGSVYSVVVPANRVHAEPGHLEGSHR